jgi:hypothetical protein
MKNKLYCRHYRVSVLIILGLNLLHPIRAQIPVMEWHKGFGTEKEEHVHEGWQTSDGGYIGVGQNWEGIEEYSNVLVVKTDMHGNEEWLVELGTDSQWDVGICVLETSGGFIVGGGFYNEVTGNQERGLVKLDYDGNIIWQKTYPGNGANAVRGLDIDTDGSIIATGYTNAFEYGFIFIIDEGEGFVMKTDADGTLIWDEPISSPQGTKVRIEQDGNIAIVSTKWVVHNGNDDQDVLLIKTDSEGKETFVKNYGEEGWDQCFDFDLTLDGGYILAGHTLSYGVINWDYFLIKIDSDGNEEWVSTFGQPRGYDPKWIHDESYAVRATPDGGYIICGGTGDEYAYSASGHPSGSSDEWKAYLVKVDSDGNLLWEAVFPDESVGNNAGEFIALTEDGGYVVFTDTDSQAPPEPNNFGFMKISTDQVVESQFFELTLTIEGEGTVYPMNQYHEKGTDITFTATPGEGWEFSHWNNETSNDNNPLIINTSENTTLQAHFKELVSGVNPNSTEDVQAYPIPAKDGILNIKVSEKLALKQVELISLGGKVVYSSAPEFKNNSLHMDVSQIKPGLYILNLIGKTEIEQVNIVIK